ncbi:MAG TPA: hypothetical protein PK867_17330 [Pirellulales bacterium]|nr:hypothetical protein [Pirellulales bacterium]
MTSTTRPLPFFLLGDSSDADISGAMKNVHRDWAKEVLATIEAMPAWSDRDFKHARAKLQGRFPTKLEFWNYLGRRQS